METRRRDRPSSGPTAANGSEAVTSAVIWSIPDSRESVLIAASSLGTYALFCKAARRRPRQMSYQPIACRIADLAVGLWPSLIPTGSACPHALRFFAQ